MTMRLLILAVLAMPVAALAQQGPYADRTTCGQFMTYDNDVQLQLLSQIEPFGDDLDATDRDAAEDWVKAVAKVCKGQDALALTEAAGKAGMEE